MSSKKYLAATIIEIGGQVRDKDKNIGALKVELEMLREDYHSQLGHSAKLTDLKKDLEKKLETEQSNRRECEKVLVDYQCTITSLRIQLEKRIPLEEELKCVLHSANTMNEKIIKMESALAKIQEIRSLTKIQRAQIKKILLY